MYTLKWLVFESGRTQTEINGKWVPCRPLLGPLISNIKDAWAVLIGEADAFTWPEGQ